MVRANQRVKRLALRLGCDGPGYVLVSLGDVFDFYRSADLHLTLHLCFLVDDKLHSLFLVPFVHFDGKGAPFVSNGDDGPGNGLRCLLSLLA